MNRLFLVFFFLSWPHLAAENWPQFRGPTGDGHSDAKDLPTTWSESQNIKWKTKLSGEGWSSPVIWENQIWLTTALDKGKSRRAICVDKETGAIIHDVEVFHVANPETKHAFNSFASPTPALEKGRVYVCFGVNGSACLDTATCKPIWVTRELAVDNLNAAGSSPILFKDFYILCCDGTDYQYVAALDKNTGAPIWKTQRSRDFGDLPGDNRKAYNTPIIVHNQGQEQLLSIGAYRIYSYDVYTGKELWYCDIAGFSNVAQPAFADGVVYVSSGFGKADLLAVRADGAGDVSKTHVLWRFKRGTPCRSTPLILGEGPEKRIYMVTDEGIAKCLSADKGEVIWQGRIGAGFSASPLYADGHLYFFDEKGLSTVMDPGPKMNVIAENTLDDGIMGTPAISGKALFIRTKTALYRIEK